jgi:hypothetical protein
MPIERRTFEVSLTDLVPDTRRAGLNGKFMSIP